MNGNTCKNCRHWTRTQNVKIGKCARLNAYQYPANASARKETNLTLIFNGDKGEIYGDFEALRTRDNFGCNGHASNEPDSKEQDETRDSTRNV
jgi:hypothetical protein